MTYLSIDSSDEASPSVPQFAEIEAQPFVGLSPDSLTTLTDDAVRSFERACFANFQVASNNTDKGRWLHAMAAAIVELHIRGLSLKGAWQ